MSAITNGTYKAKATGQVVLGTSSQKGTPFIEFYFAIIGGEHEGKTVRWTSYFSEKTSERTIQSLQYCGWQGEDLAEFADGGLHGLDTNEVAVVVELEEYDDRQTGEKKTAAKVQWVNKAVGYLNTANAMNQEAALSFSEKMRGLVIAMKEKSAGTDFAFGANAPAPPPVPAAPPSAPAAGAKRAF
jgi:hypothetical protein